MTVTLVQTSGSGCAVRFHKRSEDSFCVFIYIYMYVAPSIAGSQGALQALLNITSQRQINKADKYDCNFRVG